MTPDEQEDEQFYRDTESTAFPKLDDHQLSLLEPLSKRQVLKRGELVFKAGQRDLGLTVVLRGEIEVFEQRDGTEQILATARERDFIGDVAMLQGTSALATARVASEQCGNTARAGSRASPGVGRTARCEHLHRQRPDHAPATLAARSGICRVARSDLPRRPRRTSTQ